jgi:hypothetical protein
LNRGDDHAHIGFEKLPDALLRTEFSHAERCALPDN